MPSSGLRCIGTPTMAVPGHLPWRSGSPHGVRGGEYDAGCAAAEPATIDMHAASVVSAHCAATFDVLILPSLS